MSAPTTKVEIQTRTAYLDRQIKTKRATLAQQADERAALVDSCHTYGDHVPEYSHDGSQADDGTFTHAGFCYRCQFCGTQMTVSQEQVSRALVVG